MTLPDLQSDSGLTWIWKWSWNCGDSSTGTSSILPSNTGGNTWLWDWNWSCDSAPAPAPSCTSCNSNVSIRLFSPGNDGDVTQTISTVSESIATTVNSTVQNVTQIVQHVTNVTQVMPPPPIPVVTPPAVLPTIELGQPAASVLPQLDALLAPLFQGTTALLQQAAAMTTSGIALVSPLAAPAERAQPTKRTKPAAEREEQAHAPPATGLQFSSSYPAPPTAPPPAPASSTGRGAAPPQARPASKSAAHRVPAETPRAPFGPSSELSVASAAPGTGSAGGTGLAILVGALLFAAPYATRWLRDASGSRPRAPFLRRPERPG